MSKVLPFRRRRGAPPGAPPEGDKEHPLPGGGTFGLAVFLASLGMLFAASLVGWLVVRLRAETWPPPGAPDLPRGLWLSTAILVALSAVMHLARAGARDGRRGTLLAALLATDGLALAFLVVQAVNGRALLAERAGAAPELWTFTFFMLTGLHAAHVLGGLVPLSIVTAKALRGAYGPGDFQGVHLTAVYWHFLDAVWLVLFAVLLIGG